MIYDLLYKFRGGGWEAGVGGRKQGWHMGDKAGIRARVRVRVGLGLGPPTFRARATP